MDKQLKPVQRDISVITDEIQSLCHEAQKTMLIYAVEIGRRLTEAKDVLPHGEWGKWLKEEVNFSQSTANKHMKIFEAYGNKQVSLFGAELNNSAYEKLSYSQAIKLLSVPDEEREEFVKNNDVEDMTIKELDKAIKERDKAIKERDEALKFRSVIDELKAKQAEAEKTIFEKEEQIALALRQQHELMDSIREERKAKLKAQELAQEAEQRAISAEENPKISENERKRIYTAAEENAEAKMQDMIDSLKIQIKEAEKAKEEAVKSEAKARTEISNAIKEKKNKEDDAAIVKFSVLFDSVQEQLDSLSDALESIKDNVAQQKRKAAFNALIDGYRYDI